MIREKDTTNELYNLHIHSASFHMGLGYGWPIHRNPPEPDAHPDRNPNQQDTFIGPLFEWVVS